MSGSNFIHGIVLVGAMVALGLATTPVEKVIGFVAVILGTANVTGGYRCHRADPPDVRPQREKTRKGGINGRTLLVN